MPNFLIVIFLYIPIFESILYNLFFQPSSFFFIFFAIFFVINFFIIKKEKFNVNMDIILRYFKFFSKSPSLAFSYFGNILNRFYTFTIFFKYRLSYDAFLIFSGYMLSKIKLIWRPLFKKFSYFGFFRSNRSKWNKK